MSLKTSWPLISNFPFHAFCNIFLWLNLIVNDVYKTQLLVQRITILKTFLIWWKILTEKSLKFLLAQQKWLFLIHADMESVESQVHEKDLKCEINRFACVVDDILMNRNDLQTKCIKILAIVPQGVQQFPLIKFPDFSQHF